MVTWGPFKPPAGLEGCHGMLCALAAPEEGGYLFGFVGEAMSIKHESGSLVREVLPLFGK